MLVTQFSTLRKSVMSIKYLDQSQKECHESCRFLNITTASNSHVMNEIHKDPPSLRHTFPS